MLPAKKIITQPGYVIRRKRQAKCLPYMIRFFVGRVCYPPKKSLRNPGMLPAKTAGKMPALRIMIYFPNITGLSDQRRRSLLAGHSYECFYSTNSISPGRQVWSIQGCRGPYTLQATNQALPGMDCSQLFSIPLGASGLK